MAKQRRRKSKFGLHAHEVLQLIERLKQTGLLESLKLMHFHMARKSPIFTT